MPDLTTSEVREGFSDTINRVYYKGERIVLKRHGKELAAIIPIQDLKFLEELEDRLDLEEVRQARKEMKRKGTIPWEKIKSDLAL
jgi:prevent-host-death family protein